jgi:hypothetical protein
MSQVIESGQGTLNYGKQPAKGTIAVAATTTAVYSKPKWFDGALGSKDTLGNEEFVDGNRWGSPSEFTDTVLGEVGDLTIQAQPTSGPFFWAQLLGKDTVTGSVDPWTHTITTAGTSGAYGTWWQKTGAAVGPLREAYFDSKVSKLVQTSSDKQNVMHLALGILALQLETYETDPAKTEDTSDPYYFPESEGAVEFDGAVSSDVNEEMIEADTGAKPYWPNSIAPTQIIEGKGTIVRSLKTIVTDVTLKKYLKAVYGSESPAVKSKPTKSVFYAVLKSKYEKSATRRVTFESPRVAIDPKDFVIGAQREGGEIDIAFGGQALKEGATPAMTIVALSGDELSYA